MEHTVVKMKIREGFVSNSSSSSFMITNKTEKDLTLVDFVKENPQLIKNYKSYYDWNEDNPQFTQKNMLISAELNNLTFDANSEQVYSFGDDDSTLVGQVFDYILDSNESESFKWSFYSSNR